MKRDFRILMIYHYGHNVVFYKQSEANEEILSMRAKAMKNEVAYKSKNVRFIFLRWNVPKRSSAWDAGECRFAWKSGNSLLRRKKKKKKKKRDLLQTAKGWCGCWSHPYTPKFTTTSIYIYVSVVVQTSVQHFEDKFSCPFNMRKRPIKEMIEG